MKSNKFILRPKTYWITQGAALFLLILSAVLLPVQAQPVYYPPMETTGPRLPKVSHAAFGDNEVLVFDVGYGFIKAAKAEMEVKPSNLRFHDRPVWQVTAKGKTRSTFNIFYRVVNRYDSYIDQEAVVPWYYSEDVAENDYRRKSQYKFDHYKGTVQVRDSVYKVPMGVQDVLSAFYAARCLNFDGIKPGKKFTLQYFLEDQIYPLEIEFMGKENIKTSAGEFRCLKFRPNLQPGRMFRKDSKMFLWITDDQNRIPVRTEVEILVGSLFLELESYKGLRHPLTSRIK